jgi:hypothetical protein
MPAQALFGVGQSPNKSAASGANPRLFVKKAV